MKLFNFSTWLNESQEEYSKRAMAQKYLQSKGMARDILAELEPLFKRERFETEMTNHEDGHTTLIVKAVVWEADTWHHDYRKRGKTRPNHYYFRITEWAADPGTVRILWHSMKDYGGEIVMDNDNPAAIVWKVKGLIK